MEKEKVEGTDKAWEERRLGADERYARVSDKETEAIVDKAAGVDRKSR